MSRGPTTTRIFLESCDGARDFELAGCAVSDLPQVRNDVDDLEAGAFCHLGDGRAFTLLEFGWQDELQPEATELIEWVRGRGVTPIVAHPERHRYFAEDPVRLRALVEAGAWLQVTVDSLLGNDGSASQASGEALLRTYTEVILATDAHNLQRCSGLSAGFAWVRDRLGAKRSEDLRARADRVLSELLGRL